MSRKTKLIGIGVAAIALLGIAVFLIFGNFINKEVKLVSYETDALAIQNLEDYSHYIEKKYGDKSGVMSFDEAQLALDECYQAVQKAKETGIYEYVEQNETCVYVRLESGRGFIFAPIIEGIQSGGDGADISIISFDTNYSENRYENTPNASDNSDKWIQVFKDHGVEATCTRYTDYDVTVDALQDMLKPGPKIIIFNTHGCYTTRGTGLLTGIKWDKKLDELNEEEFEEYRAELLAKEGMDAIHYDAYDTELFYRIIRRVKKEDIVTNQNGRFLCMPSFFQLISEENYLDKSLVILGACSSTKDYHNHPDSSLVTSLLSRGAETVIGFDEPVLKTYCNLLIDDFLSVIFEQEAEYNYLYPDFHEEGFGFSRALQHAIYTAEWFDSYVGNYCYENALIDLAFGKAENPDGYAFKLVNVRYREDEYEEEDISYLDWTSPTTNDIDKGQPFSCSAEIYGNTSMTIAELISDIRVDSVDVPKEYYIIDGKVVIDKFHVTYKNVATDEISEEDITDFTLEIDGEKVTDKTNVSGKQAEEGEHSIRISWTKKDMIYIAEKKTAFVKKGDRVIWVVEPTEKYSDVGQLEIAYTGAFSEGVVYNKSGYSQQWYDATDPESGESFMYSPNAIAVKANSLWGIIDYDGNVLMKEKIPNAEQNTYPFGKGLGVNFQAIWYREYSSYNPFGVNHALSKDFKEVMHSEDVAQRGGIPSSTTYVYDGAVYEKPWGWGNLAKQVSDVSDLKGALIAVSPEAEIVNYLSTVSYVLISNEMKLVSQNAYYIKNYVNGYYVGLPEMAENSFDPSSGDLVYGASFVATPVSPNQKFAIIDASSGNPITDYKYFDALYFEEGYCPVSRDGKWGFIDSTGAEVTEMIFDKVSTVYDGKVAVIIDGKFAIINLKDSAAGGLLTKEAMDDAMAEIVVSDTSAMVPGEDTGDNVDDYESEISSELSADEINDVLSAINGKWLEVGSSKYYYTVDGLDITLSGFDSVYNNDPDGYKTRVNDIEEGEINGREAFIIMVPYSDDIRLWSVVVYKDDIKGGKCKKMYAVYRAGYSRIESELERTEVDE